MKFNRLFIPICFALICIIVNAYFISPDEKRAKFCRSAKPLTQIQVDSYDVNGIKSRGGTFIRKVSLDSKRELQVVIFPEAVSQKTWSSLPQSSIKYIGKGGDSFWQESLRPDYFYLLEVPPQATGLAFGRLCYRNGDVTVRSINKLKQVSPGKIIINDKIYLNHSSPLPTINSYNIVVNAGSDRRDTLGEQTEVYFTTD